VKRVRRAGQPGGASDASRYDGVQHRILSAGGVILALVAATAIMSLKLSAADLFIYDTGLLAAMGAVALNMLMGTAGQISIGNAAFLGIGSFACVWFLGEGIGFPYDIVLATITAGIAGLIVGIPALRLQGLYLALATLAATYVVYFICNQYQTDSVGAASGFIVNPLFSSGTQSSQERDWAWLLTILLGCIVFIAASLSLGRSGRAWRLIRDHELVASALGVNVPFYKLSVFVISSMIIGFEGAWTAYLIQVVTIDQISLTVAISYIAMILIGGLDSILGALIGAMLITVLPTAVTDTLPRFLGASYLAKVPQISEIIYGALIIFFITRSPQGIVGWSRSIGSRLVSLNKRWGLARRLSSAGGGVALSSAEDVVSGAEADDCESEPAIGRTPGPAH